MGLRDYFKRAEKAAEAYRAARELRADVLPIEAKVRAARDSFTGVSLTAGETITLTKAFDVLRDFAGKVT